MNILAPVRRDRVLAELPQVGARATSDFWLLWYMGGEEAAPDQLEAWAQPCSPARPAASGWSPPHPQPRAAWLWDEGQEWVSPTLLHPCQCLRKEAALHVHKDFHPRVTCACQEHRTGTVG